MESKYFFQKSKIPLDLCTNTKIQVIRIIGSVWNRRQQNMKYIWSLGTFSEFGSKSGPKKISKKKLFFLAMFKNEITTFFLSRFFWKFFFQKNGHNFFDGPIFFMKFFFLRFRFFWHGWNHLLMSKFYWKKWQKNALENHVPDLKSYD